MKLERRAFTLIEMLIASAILALLLIVTYKLYFGVSRSFQLGSWSLNAQNKLRNALNFVREEMQKASFKTEVGLNGVTGNDTGYEFQVANGELTNGVIAKWFICIPFVAYDDPGAGAVYQCELKLDNGKLIYSKALIDGSDSNKVETSLSNYTIITNISKVELSNEDFDLDKLNAGKLVVIKIEVHHPDTKRFPNAHVVAQTGAKIELKVINL